jgi:hypothetical protein
MPETEGRSIWDGKDKLVLLLSCKPLRHIAVCQIVDFSFDIVGLYPHFRLLNINHIAMNVGPTTSQQVLSDL